MNFFISFSRSDFVSLSSIPNDLLIIAMANRPVNPATGLLIYQIDNTAGFYFYDGTDWRLLTANMPSSTPTNARTNIIENSSLRGKNQ